MPALNPFSPPTAAVDDLPVATRHARPKVLSWRGRIGRLRFLCYLTVGYIATLMSYAVLSLATLTSLRYVHSQRLEEALVLMPFGLFVVYGAFAVLCGIQRSHDMGWRGWTVLLALIPLVGFVWMFKPGTTGDNRFGAPPVANGTGVTIGGLLGGGVLVGLVVAGFVSSAYDRFRNPPTSAAPQASR